MREGEAVPEGWKQTTFGAVLERRQETAKINEELLSVTADHGVVPQGLTGRRNISSADKSAYLRVYPGDIVYNTMRMWQGVSGCSAHRGIVSPAYTVCTPVDGVDGNFMAKIIRHPHYVAQFRRLAQGLTSDVWNLRYPAFATIPVSIPSRYEQQRIAEILDAMDEELILHDRILSKLERLRVGVLMSSLGGIDNSESASGWIRLPLSEVVPSVQYGISSPLFDEAKGTPVLRMNNVGEGKAGFGELKYTTDHVSSEMTLHYGDILFNRTNSIDQVGRSGMWRGESPCTTFASYLVRLDMDCTKIVPQYLALWLTHPGVRRRIRSISTPAVQQVNVNPTKLRELEIDLPLDLEEQEHVCARLEAADDHMAAERARLGKLQLMKKGLMDDLLTGKVRVGDIQG